MEVHPIRDDREFGARLTGIDIAALDDEAFSALERAANVYAVLVVTGQDIDDDDQIAFSRRFGPLEHALHRDSVRMGFAPEISHLGNVDKEGNRLAADSRKVVYDRGNQSWHTDSSFKKVPARFSILSARVLPGTGGGTEFADARDAYDTWQGAADGTTKEDLADAVCGHSIVYSRMVSTGDIFTEEEKKETPPSRQRLVRRHRATGRRNFYAGAHASHIEGWPERQGRAVLDEINDWIVRRERVYSHEWTEHDLVIWDNRRVLHRGLPWPDGDETRVMHRTTVAGECPSPDEPA